MPHTLTLQARISLHVSLVPHRAVRGEKGHDARGERERNVTLNRRFNAGGTREGLVGTKAAQSPDQGRTHTQCLRLPVSTGGRGDVAGNESMDQKPHNQM